MSKASVGIIGGTGLYQIEGLKEVERISVETPFGRTSAEIVVGEIGGILVAFLPRHGVGHSLLPSEIPVRANIWVLKSLGVRQVISVSAVGSLREAIAPSEVVIPNQIVDRTKQRESTFFGNGIATHVSFADPFCPTLSRLLSDAGKKCNLKVHTDKTLVVMEGPQFSTRAESNLHRTWGGDIINMTTVPEAKLAREAELCYATIACVTDYDVWHEHEEDVTADLVIRNLQQSVESAKRLLLTVLPQLSYGACPCATALDNSILTVRENMPEHAIKDLAPILKRYFGK